MSSSTATPLSRYLDKLNDIHAAAFIAAAAGISPRTLEPYIEWIRRGCVDEPPTTLRRGNRLDIQRAFAELNQVFADHEEACARRKDQTHAAA